MNDLKDILEWLEHYKKQRVMAYLHEERGGITLWEFLDLKGHEYMTPMDVLGVETYITPEVMREWRQFKG